MTTPRPPARTSSQGGNEAASSRSRPQGAATAVRDGGGRAAEGRRGRRRDPWRSAFFGILVLAVLGVIAWAVLGSSLLVVRHIEVTGNHLVTAAQVRQTARIPVGTPLARVNTAAAARRVEQLPPVLSVTVRRSWPDAVIITVRERTPALAVALIGGGYELIDSHGVVVRTAAQRPAWIALLSAAPAVLRGSPAVRAAALVTQHLPGRLSSRLVSVSAASAGAVTLHLRGGITVLWGSTGQAAHKAAELILLLRTGARYYDVSDPATAVTRG